MTPPDIINFDLLMSAEEKLIALRGAMSPGLLCPGKHQGTVNLTYFFTICLNRKSCPRPIRLRHQPFF